MNILPVSLQNNNLAKRNLLNNCQVIQPKYAHTLERDTVSFGGSTTKLSEFVTKSVAQNSKRMDRIATTYLDVLESVAIKLKEFGISFDRIYCELNPVKSPESYTSKVIRSKTFNVPDHVRATLYMNNPYDLSILNDKLLPEMEKRGYILSDTEMKVKDLMKRGYIPTPQELANPDSRILIPDLDIRLEDVADQAVKLSPELKYSIGTPQKSGYEDIQMRFKRDFDPKENPVQHELIILLGPEYAKAKHTESEKVYSLLRKFDEINMPLYDKTIGSNSHKAGRYVDLIKQMFRGKISEKLFLNAKNKDLYEIEDSIPIQFSDDDILRLRNYFTGLRDRLNSYYIDKRKRGKISQTVVDYLNTNQKNDRKILREIQEGLNKTIEYFKIQNDLEKQI